jgi:hypothetical protein
MDEGPYSPTKSKGPCKIQSIGAMDWEEVNLNSSSDNSLLVLF